MRIAPALDRLRLKFRFMVERRFDRLHGIETTEWIDNPSNGLAPEHIGHIGAYVATSAAVFRRLLRRSELDMSDFTFIDLGCGKGRLLLLATAYGFRRIIGIEADREFAALARNNIEQWAARRPGPTIEVVHGDAQDVAFPAGDLMFYMYNPFGREVTAAIANRLAALACEPGRAIVIAYLGDLYGDLIDRTGKFRRVRVRRRLFWRPSGASLFYNEAAWRMRRK